MQPELLIIAGIALVIVGVTLRYARTQKKRASEADARSQTLEESNAQALVTIETVTKERNKAEDAAIDLSRSLQATEANLTKLQNSHRTLKGNYTRLKTKISAQA